MEKIKAYLNSHDIFCRELGIELTALSPGQAQAVLKITPRHCNSMGAVQGGAVFSLADFAFAGAVNAYGKVTVTENSELHYLKSSSGTFLRAEAREIHRSRSRTLCEVKVYNDQDELTASGLFKGAILPQDFPPVPEK